MDAHQLKKLSKNGNSVAVIIEKPMLEVLGATPDSFVKRTIEGKKLILEFVTPDEREKLIREASDRIVSRHSKIFKKLAE
jgi:antitoxin component of MazEF toxin-antitoxin module